MRVFYGARLAPRAVDYLVATGFTDARLEMFKDNPFNGRIGETRIVATKPVDAPDPLLEAKAPAEAKGEAKGEIKGETTSESKAAPAPGDGKRPASLG
jgi:hypothetical protein